MELELKHLAPYLPYGLKLQYVVREKVEKTGVMKSISHNEDETHPTRVSISLMYNEEHIWMFKPILKSLQKFDQDEFFKLQDFIGLGNWCDAYDEYFTAWFDDAANVDKLILQAPYKVIQFFFLEHYDVFGLIDAGLAVELKD